MNKERLVMNLERQLDKIEKQDKIYGVGETRYDLMIRDVLNYVENSIPKQEIKNIIKKYKPDSTETFITNQENYIKLYEELQELLEEK